MNATECIRGQTLESHLGREPVVDLFGVRVNAVDFLSRDKHRMATRVIKLREAEEPAPKMVQEVLSQSKSDPRSADSCSKWIGKRRGHTRPLKLPKRLEW